MRIASSDVTMSSTHSYVETNTLSESLRTWKDSPNTGPIQIDYSKLGLDTLEISEEAKQLQLSQGGNVTGTENMQDPLYELSDKDKEKLQLLEDFFLYFLGKKIKFVIPKKIHLEDPKISAGNTSGQAIQAPQRLGWGLTYNRTEIHKEAEATTFNAQAAIKTQDGREINLSMELNLSRSFISQSQVNIRAGDAVKVDPLVVNYAAASASVTDRKYAFDIDSDGTSEQISFAGPGSGFLALDLNNDGTINNGGELFGPNSGNGFTDLSAYDSDSNGWIDENDPIYDKLRIWSKDESGNDTLFALGEKGIGAVYLGSAETSFELNNMNNQMNAQLQRTGIFLRENGTAGTIQHIDLAI